MHIRNLAGVQPAVSPHGEIVRETLGTAAGGASQHSLAHITLPPGTASLKHYHQQRRKATLSWPARAALCSTA